jgi:5-formyltetrahydrofolate cyclo-ligase
LRYHAIMAEDRCAHAHDTLTGPALHDAKRMLRARMLEVRDALDGDYRAAASTTIAQRILALPSFALATCVLLTLPYRSEWDTRSLFAAARAAGKTVVLPRVDGDARMLELHAVRDIAADTAPGHRGIPEPRPGTPRVVVDAIDWVLVPGVAFDTQGGRLGYGGGFYDRLLSLLRPRTPRIAGAFDAQLVERVPAALHDLPVDRIETESRSVTPAA